MSYYFTKMSIIFLLHFHRITYHLIIPNHFCEKDFYRQPISAFPSCEILVAHVQKRSFAAVAAAIWKIYGFEIRPCIMAQCVTEVRRHWPCTRARARVLTKGPHRPTPFLPHFIHPFFPLIRA